MSAYTEFLAAKSQLDGRYGFVPNFEHPRAFDFQAFVADWMVRQGRGAAFMDCGLGKTLCQMIWADNVTRHTNKPVLILAPLMVSMQTVKEGEKFDFEVRRSLDGKITAPTVTTNYDRLHHFDPDDFAGVVCDEASVLKNFDGATKSAITEFMRRVEYRSLWSATPSPNDYIELGTSSEALGMLGFMDMLGTFFKNDEDSLHPAFIGAKWRFKSHAEQDFWRWVCSWARAVRRPSDIGFEDGAFVLPELIERDHVIDSPVPVGHLLAPIAIGLAEEREERKATIEQRCAMAADLRRGADTPGVSWCHLNAEADMMVAMLDGAQQIKGSDPDERKEELMVAFQSGQLHHLVTKPKIAAFGVNWQHAHHMTLFADHSFEQYYQAVRRMWRYGQTHTVTADMVSTEGLARVTKNQRTKARATEAMFEALVRHMNNAMSINRLKSHNTDQEFPAWL